jgi:class 3 adenylate cyclase
MSSLDNFRAVAPVVLTVVGLLCGMLGVMARLYHNKALAKKDIELQTKDLELEGKNAELARAIAGRASAEARANRADVDVHKGDLPELQQQLQALVESLAELVNAQAASLYIPVFTDLTRQANAPRSFAFVAVFNESARSASAILKMRVVEIWTMVGECWMKDTLIANSELQQDARHLASYDAQSGFVPLNTLALPVRWQGKQIGVLQLFNKKLGAKGEGIDLNGFSTQDQKLLSEALRDLGPAGIASCTYHFQASPIVFDFLGLREETSLENAVIMHVDLTSSSTLFSEVSLQDAAQMLRVFSEYIHNEMLPYSGVVERFIGDGALIRFHFVGFDSHQPATNPVVRAVYAAERLLRSFNNFKESFWRDLTHDASDAVKLRMAIALGPVVSINMGSLQNAAPTVMGPCVNRSAKMVAHAPRDRDVVLVDENASKALSQQKNQRYVSALTPHQWHNESVAGFPFMRDGSYFELELNLEKLPPLEFRPLSRFSAI